MTDNGTGRTQYMVLRQNTKGHWIELAVTPAHNAHAACVRAASEHVEPTDLELGVRFRAVSARSWHAGATNLTVQHQTKVVPS